VRSKVVEPGYAWIRLSQFQERTVDDFARKLEEIYKEEPNLKGLVLDLRNDPGGLLDAGVAVAAAFLPENVTVVSTNGQLAESKFVYKASPEFYLRRGNSDPLKPPARGREERAPGGAGQRRLCLGQRNRGRRLARPQTRHHHGQPDLRQGFGADGAPTGARHRPQDHHRALLHTQRQVDPGQGHRSRCDGGRNRRRQPFAALRTREADLEKHLGSGQGEEKSRTWRAKRRVRKHSSAWKKKPASRCRPQDARVRLSDKDFQLMQALNQLKGRPVLVSKTLVERKDDKKEN
jgi:carboxyl-terminal processing protease